MPHESTVEHEEMTMGAEEKQRYVAKSRSIFVSTPSGVLTSPKDRTPSLVPHMIAETPKHILHHHDDDDEDIFAASKDFLKVDISTSHSES